MSEEHHLPGPAWVDDGPTKPNSFECVLLDTPSSQLGVWNDAAECARLKVHFSTGYLEPRIDIGLSIKWRDGKVSHEKQPPHIFFRMIYDQMKSLEALRIVDRSNTPPDTKVEGSDGEIPTGHSSTNAFPLFFHEAYSHTTHREQIEVFSELYAMGLEKERVDNLVSEKRLWVIAIVLEPGVPRFGPGLFNMNSTYGSLTTTVHKIRDKLYQEQYLHFVVRADDLQSIVKDFREACKEMPKVPLADFFPQHPQHPFLQEGDYASTENRPYVKSEVNLGFRDWYHYNTFVGYGTIIQHESELKRANNGELFAAQIQVFAISREDSNTYMACLRLPDKIQRRSVGSSVHIHWHTHAEEATDPWRGDVIEPLPAASTDTTSLIIYRPSKETHGARQPKIASNLKDAPFENVMVKIIVSDKTFNRFLGCNRDLQHWSKAEVCRELLGGDLMVLPRIGLLSDVNRELIDTTFAHGRVNLDISKVIDGLPRARGRFFVVTGPAGSGKTYVMHLLSLLILKGSKMFYPVHPEGATGKWMPNFHKYKSGTSEMEDEPEKREHKPQVVISCPTNNLTSDNCVKLQCAADNLFAGEPIMIIRIHSLELEFLIAKQTYTHHEQHSRTAEMEHDQQAVEEINVEGMIKVLSEVLEHYQKSFSSAGFATTGIKDSRLQLIEHSLGYRMLQVCGIIPGSLWTVSGAYENFVAFHQDRLRHASELNEAQELAFRKDMIRLARETLARADILIGTPFVLGTYLIYSSLHPSVFFMDEAGMSKESDLLPLITYYFPKAFGVFGDPQQLGPTIMSTMEENSFHGQIELSLLSRLILNGCTRFDFVHQHRLTKDIYNFTNQLFYRGKTRWQRTQVIDPNAWSSKVMNFNFHRYKVKKNMVFLNIPKGQEFSVGHSWANRAHVVVGLNLAYDFIMSCSIPPADIVILVGYDAQKREYLSEMSRRVESNPGIKWLDIRVTVIGSFQGNQAPFVILDLVRSETLGHLRSFRRLNVGMTRGSFGLWCLYNVNSMMKPIDRDTWVIREMRSLIKGSRLSATLALPQIERLCEDNESDKPANDVDPTRKDAFEEATSRIRQRQRMRESEPQVPEPQVPEPQGGRRAIGRKAARLRAKKRKAESQEAQPPDAIE